jgi:glycosyltransferase involved in cell wall biosynthesis
MDKDLNSPLFSVVIPAYNRAEIITRTIDSVLAQTFSDFEIIVVDDGSTDDLKKVCDKYNSSRIHYIYQNNAGSNPARNNGIRNSRGYYVSFLDSDDTWETEYLDEALKKFNSDNEIGFVWVKNIKKYLPEGVTTLKKYKKLEGFVYREVLKQGYLINSSCITVKRSLLETIGGWDNDLRACQDDDICFRLAKITKIGCVDKVLSTFYIDERFDRISASSSRRAWNSFFLWQKFADDLLSYCGENELVNKMVTVYLRFLQINDREGLQHCEQFLIKHLRLPQLGMFQFRLKCIYALILSQTKNAIKKITPNMANSKQ